MDSNRVKRFVCTRGAERERDRICVLVCGCGFVCVCLCASVSVSVADLGAVVGERPAHLVLLTLDRNRHNLVVHVREQRLVLCV